MLKRDKLALAEIFARQSKCKRKKVGCVIMRDDRVISSGYNGTPTKSCNNCEDEQGNTKISVLHAEVNAIAFAAKNGISINNSELYITLSPCISCAALIIASGITKVIYKEEYRDTRGIEFLEKHGVLCYQLNLV